MYLAGKTGGAQITAPGVKAVISPALCRLANGTLRWRGGTPFRVPGSPYFGAPTRSIPSGLIPNQDRFRNWADPPAWLALAQASKLFRILPARAGAWPEDSPKNRNFHQTIDPH
jgi:hypothetical protein